MHDFGIMYGCVSVIGSHNRVYIAWFLMYESVIHDKSCNVNGPLTAIQWDNNYFISLSRLLMSEKLWLTLYSVLLMITCCCLQRCLELALLTGPSLRSFIRQCTDSQSFDNVRDEMQVCFEWLKWAAPLNNLPYAIWEQQSGRRACESRRRLWFSLSR